MRPRSVPVPGSDIAKALAAASAAIPALIVLAACAAPPVMDFSSNPQLYKGTGYRAKLPVDRRAYVANVVDEREQPRPAGNYPVTYLADADWARPLPHMVHDVLVEELRESGLFTELLDAPAPDALLVKPILRAFDGGIEEQPYGRRSLASFGLVLEVWGPEEQGRREVLFTRPFYDRQGSNSTFKPPSPRVLMGHALQATMSKVVANIDQSNVSRSTVPREASLKDG
jgi:hypothetical protein